VEIPYRLVLHFADFLQETHDYISDKPLGEGDQFFHPPTKKRWYVTSKTTKRDCHGRRFEQLLCTGTARPGSSQSTIEE
jgi:hypothetical protein